MPDEIYRKESEKIIINDLKNIHDFDPRNITQYHMDKLADCIETFADLMGTIAIVQDGAPKGTQEGLDEGLKRVKILLKKLRKGDRRVFKDDEEWNDLK